MKTVKCLYCSKKVAVSRKGHLLSHLNGGGVKCVGIGAKAAQMEALNRLTEQAHSTKPRRPERVRPPAVRGPWPSAAAGDTTRGT